MSTVLVTGGSGFLASFTIAQLLREGHSVRTTVRDLKREAHVRSQLQAAGVEAGTNLEVFAADLEQDAGWAEAVEGCEYVQHLASPFPAVMPKDENEVIRPAREGAIRVLKMARAKGVRRVVLTSSFAAIGYGHPAKRPPLTEADWSRIEGGGATAYVKSKTLAERAAWDFMATEGGKLELVAINPVAIFGPVLGADFASSIGLVKALLEGKMPATPKLYFGGVDVRDVADLHVKAMLHPAAKGERFLAAADRVHSLHEMSLILRKRLGERARRAPTKELPNWLVRVSALVSKQARQNLSQLGKRKDFSNEKARRFLDWRPRSTEEALVATAESLFRLNLV